MSIASILSVLWRGGGGGGQAQELQKIPSGIGLNIKDGGHL